MTGVLFGVGGAALFGLAAVCSRVGMRYRAGDDGLFMTVLVNVLVLSLALPLVELPPWDGGGVAAFAVGGLLGTFFGRALSLAAVRRIGVARANAFQITAPLFAALAGWFLLDERVGLVQGLGALLVLAGLAVIVRSRAAAESLLTPAEQPNPRPAGRLATLTREPRTMGLLFAATCPVLFGLGFVARRWGILHFPSVVAGALFGTLTSLTMIVATTALAGRLRRLARDNLASIPWWFVAAGLLTSAGLILQFNAFVRLPAWAVSLLQGTQGMWVLLWSFLFIREEERIGPELVLAVLLVTAGVAVMGLG